MGTQSMLQDAMAKEVSATRREILCRYDPCLTRSKTRRTTILATTNGLHRHRLGFEICHCSIHTHSFLLPWQYACGMVSTMGDVDDIHIESYTRRKWCGRTYVSSLLCRFLARCLCRHSCRHALASHLLLSILGDGNYCATKMDRAEIPYYQ